MRFIEKFADFMSGLPMFKMSFERKLAKEHVRKVSNTLQILILIVKKHIILTPK